MFVRSALLAVTNGQQARRPLMTAVASEAKAKRAKQSLIAQAESTRRGSKATCEEQGAFELNDGDVRIFEENSTGARESEQSAK